MVHPGHLKGVDTIFVLHYNCGMLKNVTITLEEEVARWARIKAAELDTSVSRLVGEMLSEKMKAEQDYTLAMQRFFARVPQQLSEPGSSYPSRDELHER